MDQKSLRKTVIDFLNGHRKAVFGIVGEGGEPTTSLMLYAIDDDLNVYFGTRKAFGKFKALAVHPSVSLTVIEEAADPLRAVEIRGVAALVPEEKTAETLAFLESKNPSKYYVKDAEDFVMFKVVPSFVRWLDATSGELALDHIAID